MDLYIKIAARTVQEKERVCVCVCKSDEYKHECIVLGIFYSVLCVHESKYICDV